MLLNRRWCANEKSWKGLGVYETWLLPTWSDRGTLEIILYVCQYNIVILNSHCHTISLLGILIWKSGIHLFPHAAWFSASSSPVHPFSSHSLQPSSPPTHTSINISITLDDYWETWAILCNHGLLFPAALLGITVFTVWHLHVITTTGSWTLSVFPTANTDIFKRNISKQLNLTLTLFYFIMFDSYLRKILLLCVNWKFSSNYVVLIVDSASPLVISFANIKCFLIVKKK